jgi:hypothetical protein
MRFRLIVCAAGLLVASTANASAFSLSFKWCGLNSPVFSISGVPKGTTTLVFRMVDLQKTDYNHGGGSIVYKGQGSVACGALGQSNYSPPSPPPGGHDYQWTVTAVGSGGNLGSASATRHFP